MRKKFYCYSCENEFTVISDEPVLFCPLCAESLETADEDLDWESNE
jgi:hypothetical protein